MSKKILLDSNHLMNMLNSGSNQSKPPKKRKAQVSDYNDLVQTILKEEMGMNSSAVRYMKKTKNKVKKESDDIESRIQAAKREAARAQRRSKNNVYEFGATWGLFGEDIAYLERFYDKIKDILRSNRASMLKEYKAKDETPYISITDANMLLSYIGIEFDTVTLAELYYFLTQSNPESSSSVSRDLTLSDEQEDEADDNDMVDDGSFRIEYDTKVLFQRWIWAVLSRRCQTIFSGILAEQRGLISVATLDSLFIGSSQLLPSSSIAGIFSSPLGMASSVDSSRMVSDSMNAQSMSGIIGCSNNAFGTPRNIGSARDIISNRPVSDHLNSKSHGQGQFNSYAKESSSVVNEKMLTRSHSQPSGTSIKAASSYGLPPLRIRATKANGKQKRKLQEQGGFDETFGRPTPRCLRESMIGQTPNVQELRDELRIAREGLDHLNGLVEDTIVWVQTNCDKSMPVSERSKKKCHSMALERIVGALGRSVGNMISRAFWKWKLFISFLDMQNIAIVYSRAKGVEILTTVLGDVCSRQMLTKWIVWVDVTRKQKRWEQEAAAVEIQKIARGRSGRNNARKKRQHRAAVKLQSIIRMFLGKRRVICIRENRRKDLAATVIQVFIRDYTAIRRAKRYVRSLRRNRAATAIQKIVRGELGRKRVVALKAYQQRRYLATMHIQNFARSYLAKQCLKRMRLEKINRERIALEREYASTKIQSVIRGFLARACVKRKKEEKQRAEELRVKQGIERAQKRAAAAEKKRLEQERLLVKSATKIQTAARRKLAYMRVSAIRTERAKLDEERRLKHELHLQKKRAAEVEAAKKRAEQARLRREKESAVVRDRAAITLQCAARTWAARRKVTQLRTAREEKIRKRLAQKQQSPVKYKSTHAKPSKLEKSDSVVDGTRSSQEFDASAQQLEVDRIREEELKEMRQKEEALRQEQLQKEELAERARSEKLRQEKLEEEERKRVAQERKAAEEKAAAALREKELLEREAAVKAREDAAAAAAAAVAPVTASEEDDEEESPETPAAKGLFAVDFEVRLVKKSLSSFRDQDKQWFCDEMARKLGVESRMMEIVGLAAGSVIVQARCWFANKQDADDAAKKTKEADFLSGVAARFGKTELKSLPIVSGVGESAQETAKEKEIMAIKEAEEAREMENLAKEAEEAKEKEKMAKEKLAKEAEEANRLRAEQDVAKLFAEVEAERTAKAAREQLLAEKRAKKEAAEKAKLASEAEDAARRKSEEDASKIASELEALIAADSVSVEKQDEDKDTEHATSGSDEHQLNTGEIEDDRAVDSQSDKSRPNETSAKGSELDIAATKIQSRQRVHSAKRRRSEKQQEAIQHQKLVADYIYWAAVTIQRLVRGRLGRRKAEDKKQAMEKKREWEWGEYYEKRNQPHGQLRAPANATSANALSTNSPQQKSVEHPNSETNTSAVVKTTEEESEELRVKRKQLEAYELQLKEKEKEMQEKNAAMERAMQELEEKSRIADAERLARQEMLNMAVGPVSSTVTTARSKPTGRSAKDGIPRDAPRKIYQGHVWVQLWDPAENAWYWYCQDTQESQWEEPGKDATGSQAYSMPMQSARNPPTGRSAREGPIPRDAPRKVCQGHVWVQLWDPAENAWYWYCQDTQESQWEEPVSTTTTTTTTAAPATLPLQSARGPPTGRSARADPIPHNAPRVVVDGEIWIQLWDQVESAWYWYCQDTEVSQWEQPTGATSITGEQDEGYESEAAMTDYSTDQGSEGNYTESEYGDAEESGWALFWDEQAQAKYWYNYATGEATWTEPEGLDAEANSIGSGRIGSSRSATNDYGGVLIDANGTADPSAWVSLVDPDTAQEYWYNSVTGETSWVAV